MIAGPIPASAGHVMLDGKRVQGPGPDRGLVLQRESLYPWRTVERNVAFGLELLPISRSERARRVDWYLRETGMTAARTQLPRQLSGGQRQRVAIARALACEPDVLLLDEPFGALDVQTKEDMQIFLRQVWEQTGITVVMVTHDVEEAVFCSQRVLVLASDPGRIAEEMPVDLPALRDLTVKRSARFLELRARARDTLVAAACRRTRASSDGPSGRGQLLDAALRRPRSSRPAQPPGHPQGADVGAGEPADGADVRPRCGPGLGDRFVPGLARRPDRALCGRGPRRPALGVAQARPGHPLPACVRGRRTGRRCGTARPRARSRRTRPRPQR